MRGTFNEEHNPTIPVPRLRLSNVILLDYAGTSFFQSVRASLILKVFIIIWHMGAPV